MILAHRLWGPTIRSSRCRFAARLNSGVRPCFPHCRWQVPSGFGNLAHPRLLHLTRAMSGIGRHACTLRLRTGATPRKIRHAESASYGRGGSFWPRDLTVLALLAPGCQAKLSGKTCCTVLRKGWAVAGRAQVPGSGGLTSRSSRIRFVTQNTWQVKLAMCFASLRCSA